MKKRVLLRILTVVLVCTMLLGLVGFAPMVETLSGSQQTIAAVDGSTGDIKDTPDAGSTDKDTGDTGDAGEKEPEPDPDPEPEPDPGKCIVTIEQPDGGTITCKQLPENGQVEKDTKLTFTVSKAENVVSSELVAVRVNENALDISKDINKKGEFTVTITEDTTISAEFFGIRSIKVWDADKWTQSKNVTIETIGSVSSKSYKNLNGEDVAIEGNNFEVTDNIGEKPVEYKITVKGGGAADGKIATADAEVKLVDNIAPTVTSSSERVNKKNSRIFDHYHWTVTVTDDGSGLDVDKLKNGGFEIFYVSGKQLELENDKYISNRSMNLPKDGSVKIEFDSERAIDYVFTAKDRVGNVNEKPSADQVKDTIPPEIKGYEMEHGSCKDAKKNIWWAGSGACLTVKATDANGVQSIKLEHGDEKQTLKPKWKDEDGAYFATFNIAESGEYKVVVTDNSQKTTEETITIQYDPNAPVFDSAKYTTSADGNWFKGLLNKITNGGLFSETVGITVAVNDVAYDKDTNTFASGVAKVEYSLVKTTTANASADKAERDGSASQEKWKGTELVIEDGKASIPIQGDFTGYIELRATDNAGNESFVTVEYDKENPDNSGELEITNKATYGEGDLIVMAKTGDGTDQKAYTKAEGAEQPEVVRSVDFDIYTTAPDLPGDTESSTTNPETNVTKTTKTTYSYGEMTVTAKYGNTTILKQNLNSDVAGNHTFEASIGKNGDVRFGGNVEFTVKYPIMKTVTVDGQKQEPPTECEVKEQTVSVPVRVQNCLDAPEIKLVSEKNGNDKGDSWFNSNGHPLTSVNLKTPDGLSDVTTAYTIWYWENGQSEEEAVKLPKTLGADETTGTITNAAGVNQTVFKGTELFKDVKDTQIQKAGHYKITAVSTDEIGNSKEAKSLVFKYDPKPADIRVAFSEKKTGQETYFNILRTAEIRVEDDTFTGSENEFEKIIPTFTFKGAEPQQVGKWIFTKNENEAEPGGIWTATYQYGVKPGETLRDGDDYQLEVSVTDNAGNTSKTDNEGKYYINGSKTAESEASHYTGDANDDFTIDQTKPVVSVVFDNNSARNEKYFSAGRTATITVTEHNFKPELSVSMTAENATVGADAKEGWTQNGDVWTKTVTFDPQDAVCKFSIDVTDLAGNECPDEDVNYGGSAAPREFVIDQVNPALEITGTNATPYADACAPGFTAHDTNMSTEYTMTLTRTVRASRNANVSDRFLTRDSVTVTGTDINAVFNTITEEAENDGIYILDVTVMDMAGNSTQATSTFTVNRHGSFYIFNEALADVVNAKYVQKADGSYQVTEYNASPLVGDSVKIEIYRDGQLVTTLTPTVGAGVIGASGLYEYTYDLPAEHFAQNGRYKVALSSLDEAKNESDNTKLDDALLEFTVDSVAPEITMIKGLEKGIVNAKELTFSAAVMDTYGIASVQILVDGKVVKEYVTQEAYDALKAGGQALDHEYAVLTNTLDVGVECKLLESSSRQHVVIAVTDMAGNVTQTDSKDFAPSYDFHENVLVSTNFWARYIHNVWALVVTGVVILALAGGIWYVTAKKKKEHTAA